MKKANPPGQNPDYFVLRDGWTVLPFWFIVLFKRLNGMSTDMVGLVAMATLSPLAGMKQPIPVRIRGRHRLKMLVNCWELVSVRRCISLWYVNRGSQWRGKLPIWWESASSVHTEVSIAMDHSCALTMYSIKHTTQNRMDKHSSQDSSLHDVTFKTLIPCKRKKDLP